MEVFENYKQFIYYLLNKVQGKHKRKMVRTAVEFLKYYERYKCSYTLEDSMVLINILRKNIKKKYKEEVNIAVDDYLSI